MRKLCVLISLGLAIAFALPLVKVVAEPPMRPVGQDMLAKIDSPLPNSVLQGRVQVKGSAQHPQFSFYKVEFGPGENPTDDQMAIIGAIHEEQVVNGLLETWDTSLVPDGAYTLRLRVVDITGNYQEDWVRRLSVNNTSPTPTPTPEVPPTPVFVPPTFTPTIIPPTPTIVVEQPFLNQPTATPPPPPTVDFKPVPTMGTLVAAQEPTATSTPRPTSTPAPSIAELVQPQQLGNALCYGALFMAGVFVFFGALSLLRHLILLLLSSR